LTLTKRGLAVRQVADIRIGVTGIGIAITIATIDTIACRIGPDTGHGTAMESQAGT